MGDKTEVLEDLLPALFYMTLKPAWLTRAYGAPSGSVRTQVSGRAWHCVRAGAKSRALVRVRQAEGIGQHYRKPTDKTAHVIGGKVYLGKGQGKAQRDQVPQSLDD